MHPLFTPDPMNTLAAIDRKVQADKIVSSAARCGLEQPVPLSRYVVAEEGYCVAVRALEEKDQYNEIECADSMFRKIEAGDVLVGVLGTREALKGYSGRVPARIQPGDTLHVLNLGGILGQCTSHLPALGPALRVEVLGAALTRLGGETLRHARLQDVALDPVYELSASAPLVMISGTAMDTGKTAAACRIIRGLTACGLRVAAAKLTGAALTRDVRQMSEHGAVATLTFADAGVVSSAGKRMQPYAKALIARLNDAAPDAIVLELGDGFIGYYGVDELLRDRELQRFTCAHVVTASDLAGAWAAEQRFRQCYRASITVLTGPITDHAVGKRFVQNELGIPARNALCEADELVALVAEAVRQHREAPTAAVAAFA